MGEVGETLEGADKNLPVGANLAFYLLYETEDLKFAPLFNMSLLHG